MLEHFLELEKFPQVIIIAGAPGSGKSSLSRRLQQITHTPLFEFGWIPEYRYRSNGEIPYAEEEEISFENLVLVTRNYIRHGFRGVILTDLEDNRIAQMGDVFSGLSCTIFTLFLEDETELARRVLQPDRSSGYRDVEGALAINRRILNRPIYPAEHRLDASYSVDVLLNQVIEILSR